MRQKLNPLLATAALCAAYAATLTAAPGLSVAAPELKATPEMRQFLSDHRITERLSPIDRMQGILDGLYGKEGGFAYAARENLTAAEAFERKAGNCISFAMVFVTLAREVGLDAGFNQIDYSPVWEEIGGILVETTHVNAIVNVAGRQYVIEGLPEYAEIASRSRNPVSDERVFSHYYNNCGLLALSEGETERAVRLVDEAIALDPTNGAAWQNLGLYRFRKGDHKGGEGALLEAARQSERSSSAYFLLSEYYRQTGETGKADKFARLGAKRSKMNPFFHYYRSQEALAQGDLKKSIKHLEKALRLLPQYSKFQLELARLRKAVNSGGSLAKRSEPSSEQTVR